MRKVNAIMNIKKVPPNGRPRTIYNYLVNRRSLVARGGLFFYLYQDEQDEK